MPFTTSNLVTQINAGTLQTWSTSTQATQGPMLNTFDAYFAGLRQWIQNNGGNATFGQRNTQTGVLDVVGLTRQNGAYASGTLPISVFTDVFYDIPHFRNQQGFSLAQAAQNLARLATQLGKYP
jgi:hypothetical protein